MASFFRLSYQLFGAGHAKAGKSSFRKASGFELLEKRHLLTGDLLASLTGTVVVDVTNNGLTDDDTVVAGAVVRLFRDGGDGVFDGGQADDSALGSQTTDHTGQYRFDGLGPGTYFVQQMPAAGLIQPGSNTVQQVSLTAADMGGEMRTPIDSFAQPQLLEAWAPSGRVATSGSAVPDALGGERDLYLEITSAIGQIEFGVGRDRGFLHYDSSFAADGTGVLTWDGIDQGDNTINYRGLGGYDLTENGTVSGISVLHGADQHGSRILLRVYTDSNRWSQGVIDIAKTYDGPTATGVVLFEDFAIGAGGGADFRNVGAVQLEIDGNPEVDVLIRRIDTFGPQVVTADFVNFQPLSLGDLVWFDADNNGVYTAGSEEGIGQVALNLYRDTDANDELSAADTWLENQQTTADGTYRFDNLLPGDYLVQVAASNFEPGGALEGLVLTTGVIAADPDDDIDHDNNGLLTSDGTTATAAVSLASLTEPVNDGDGSPHSNLTVDIGFTLFDLSITKTASPEPATAGESLTYTLVVTNHGPADAADVVVVDTLPQGLSQPQVSSSQGSASHEGHAITAALGTLPSGATTTLTIVAHIDPGFSGRLDNMAHVAGRRNTHPALPNDPWRERNLTNNQDAASTEVHALVDLAIDKSDQPDPVIAGQQLTYTLHVTNNGPSTATGVTVTDQLPDAVQLQTATSSQGLVSAMGNAVTVNLGTLVPGASASIDLLTQVDSGAPHTLLNTTTVTSDQIDTNPNDNSDDEPTTVRGLFDLEVVKTDSVDPVMAGDQLAYTIVVTNHGPSDAKDVVMIDDLPDEVTFLSAETTQGTVGEADGRVRAELGYLASGQSETVTIFVNVGFDVAEQIENVAIVDGNPVQVNPLSPGIVVKESNLDNNFDDELTRVQSMLSSISGYVYVDLNNDGRRGRWEPPIAGVEIQLSGTDVLGNSISRIDLTDSHGHYSFRDLLPGSYTAREIQPAGFRDGIDTPGRVAGGTGLLPYTVHDDMFAGIGLAGGLDAVEFNFGELMHAPSKRAYLASTPTGSFP